MSEFEQAKMDRLSILRQKAEDALIQQEKKMKTGVVDATEVRRLLHELEVYQTELEMQNAELRYMQGQLEEVADKYADLYDFAPVAYFTLDMNGVIKNANITGAHLIARNRGELMNKPFALFVAKNFQNEFREYLSKIRKGTRRQEGIEIRILRIDGSAFFVRAESVLLPGKKGEGDQIRMVLLDISDRIDLEEALKTKNQELSDFASRLSHDIRAPLSMIGSLVEMIEEMPEKIGEVIPKIFYRLNKLIDYIENLLNLARSGKVIEKKEQLRLDMIVHGSISMLKEREAFKDAIVEIDEAEVWGDCQSLFVIFSNLLENAVRYKDPTKEKLQIRISTSKTDENIDISFKSNSIAIDKQNLQRIFEPGFTVSKEKGTGFGLAIAKKIVEAHNGKIIAQCQGEGKGVEFLITLPLK